MEILLNVFKYLLQVLVERDAQIEALKKNIPASVSDKILDDIRQLCCQNLKYGRMSAGGYEYRPTRTTAILEKIINIIDTERQKQKRG